ncbi:MAG: hypothetical protein WCS37_20285 [Chloroflexota bacterium]
MLENPLAYFVFGLLFAWVGSYFYSAWHNRRKLTWMAHWLEEPLRILGSRITSRWNGTDQLNISIKDGNGVISEAIIVLGAQSRRIFNLIISLLRGGRDSMSFLIQIKRNPPFSSQFEIFGIKEPPPRMIALDAQAWQVEDYPKGAPYRVAFKTKTGRESAFRLIALLHDLKLEIRRISVRSTVPQLFLVFNLNTLPQFDSAELLRIIRSLTEEVSQPLSSETKPAPKQGKAKTKTKTNELSPDFFRPGLDRGLQQNGYHTSNGHHPEE